MYIRLFELLEGGRDAVGLELLVVESGLKIVCQLVELFQLLAKLDALLHDLLHRIVVLLVFLLTMYMNRGHINIMVTSTQPTSISEATVSILRIRHHLQGWLRCSLSRW